MAGEDRLERWPPAGFSGGDLLLLTGYPDGVASHTYQTKSCSVLGRRCRQEVGAYRIDLLCVVRLVSLGRQKENPQNLQHLVGRQLPGNRTDPPGSRLMVGREKRLAEKNA